MPVLFGTVVTSATYLAGILTANGQGFGDQIYPVTALDVSTDGVSWTGATLISLTDTEMVGSFSPALPPGTYRVRVTSSNDETSDPLLAAFTVESGVTVSHIMVGVAVGV